MVLKKLQCKYSCNDVEIVKYVPQIDINPDSIKLIMISEAMPRDISDYFYQQDNSMFLQTTNQAFSDAGYNFKSIDDYLKSGIYLTTAIKCKKKDYLVSTQTLKNCSLLLQNEIGQFKNIKVIMLMGDFAIKCINYIWKNKYKKNIIPPGSTYKIRSGLFESNGIRFFPSYTQTGDSFNIEKVKRLMIVEDINKAMSLIQ
jgi:uracil-DNA glycosylase